MLIPLAIELNIEHLLPPVSDSLHTVKTEDLCQRVFGVPTGLSLNNNVPF